MTTFIKDPDAVLDYSVDWSKWLAGDQIQTSAWSVSDPAIKPRTIRTLQLGPRFGWRAVLPASRTRLPIALLLPAAALMTARLLFKCKNADPFFPLNTEPCPAVSGQK